MGDDLGDYSDTLVTEPHHRLDLTLEPCPPPWIGKPLERISALITAAEDWEDGSLS
jgi:hypothetical protein